MKKILDLISEEMKKAFEEAGYDRYFGFEYWPTYDNEKSLCDILKYVRG